MGPYDQMLANEWEQHVAEDEDDEDETSEMSADDMPDWWHFEQAIEREREAAVALAAEANHAILWGGLDRIARERLRAALDAYNEAKVEHHYSPPATQDLADEKAQERRWRVE